MSIGETRYEVLVVDDNPDHRLLIRAAFAHHDPHARVLAFASAEEAMHHLAGPWFDSDLGPNEAPDVIVTDIRMSGIGGLGFLEWYSTRKDLAAVPVVVFTSSDEPGLAESCFTFGVQEFRTKSFDFAELVTVVKNVLAQVRQEKTIARSG